MPFIGTWDNPTIVEEDFDLVVDESLIRARKGRVSGETVAHLMRDKPGIVTIDWVEYRPPGLLRRVVRRLRRE